MSVSRTLVRTLTRATQSIALQPNDTQRYPWVKLADLRLGRWFTVNSMRFEVFADAYNLLNANAVLTDNTVFGTSLGVVSATINPRVVRMGARLDF